MKYKVFDERNVTLIITHFVNDMQDTMYFIVSYNSVYNKECDSRANVDFYIKLEQLNVINQYELHYYNKAQMMCEFEWAYGFEHFNMRTCAKIRYRKQADMIEDLKPGNRYLLENYEEILYLGFVESLHYYLPFKEFEERMRKGKKEYGMDEPQRLRKKKVVGKKKIPRVIGDMGPYWNEQGFVIKESKIEQGE